MWVEFSSFYISMSSTSYACSSEIKHFKVNTILYGGTVSWLLCNNVSCSYVTASSLLLLLYYSLQRLYHFNLFFWLSICLLFFLKSVYIVKDTIICFKFVFCLNLLFCVSVIFFYMHAWNLKQLCSLDYRIRKAQAHRLKLGGTVSVQWPIWEIVELGSGISLHFYVFWPIF